MLTSGALVSHSFGFMGRSSIDNIWRAYLYREELVPHPLANLPIIVLTWHTIFAILFARPFSFPRLEALLIAVVPRAGRTQPLEGVSFDIFLELALLDQVFDMFFKLVEIFCMLSLDLMEFTPSFYVDLLQTSARFSSLIPDSQQWKLGVGT